MDAVFCVGFVFGLFHPGRQHRHMVMFCQFLVTRVQVGVIVVWFFHPALEIVWSQDLGDATKESEGANMPCQPVLQFLRRLDLRIHIAARRQGGHEDRRLPDLSRLRVRDGHCHPRIIHFHLLAPFVRQTHAGGMRLVPTLVVLPKLGISIPVRIFLPIFLPQQFQGHPFARQVSMHCLPVWQGALFHLWLFYFRK